MENDNKKICEIILKNWYEENKLKKIGFKNLPSNIDFFIANKNVEMHLKAESVTKNMQEDDCAFEGWALVIKRWAPFFEKIILNWNQPTLDNLKETEKQHYQRFLFRALNFKIYFNWFMIKTDSSKLLEDFVVLENDENKYFVNVPDLKNRNKPDDDLKYLRLDVDFNDEKNLEWHLVNEKGKFYEQFRNLVDADFLDYKLPVGLFFKIDNKNRIFPGLNSAIDIWGINKKKELLIFELKKEGNIKIGMISELFFYVCMMQYVQIGKFIYRNSDDINVFEIAKTQKINAYFLAPKIHPLIDKALIEIMNNNIQKNNKPKVEFDCIIFDVKCNFKKC